MSLKNHSKLSLAVLMRSGLLIAISFGVFSGCAMSRKSQEASARKTARLEVKLRKANARIETLRERNWVLKNRIKIIEANEGVDPATAPSRLAAFPEGVETDVQINPTVLRPQAASVRSNAALMTRLPKKISAKRRPAEQPAVQSVAQAPKVIGESADRVLARTVTELLRSGDEVEADRTALLLAKSYPESELVAEARFQQGLYHFKKGNMTVADRHFRATLTAPKSHVRARAGAALLRGVIARKAGHVDLAQKSFTYVTGTFPGSPEAARARREARALKRLEPSAIVRKK